MKIIKDILLVLSIVANVMMFIYIFIKRSELRLTYELIEYTQKELDNTKRVLFDVQEEARLAAELAKKNSKMAQDMVEKAREDAEKRK